MISVSASLSYFSIPITTTATNNTHMHPIKISMVRTDTLILSYIRSFMDLFFRRSFSSCSRLFSSVSSSKVFSPKASTVYSDLIKSWISCRFGITFNAPFRVVISDAPAFAKRSSSRSCSFVSLSTSCSST